MGQWITFIHPPRDDFAATMTDEERAPDEAVARRFMESWED